MRNTRENLALFKCTDEYIYNHGTFSSLCDDVTKKHFYEKILYLNGNKWLELALNVFSNIKGPSWALELSILMLKYGRKFRHGYMYAIRTYNHGRFSSPCDDVTTKHFYEKILYFKGRKWFELTVYVLSNIKGTSWALELSILMLKWWRKFRHGYMYALGTYNHGTF